jgi:hypothetical protein
VADINERLDRLQRREEFDRFGRPLRPAPAELPVGPVVAWPAGVDDRLGEVLDAVAAVVRRHAGLSVMVALADGRPGRPVIRVTERDGGVETGVVMVGSARARGVEPTPEPLARDRTPTEYGPYDGMSTPAAAPARGSVPGSDPVFEPALRDRLPARDAVQAGREPAGSVPVNGRHAADRPVPGHDRPTARGEPWDDRPAEEREERPGVGWSGSSWHDALWSPGSRDRFRPAEPDRPQAMEDRGTGPTIPLPEDTSQVVSRLAQLLRDNPTLAASWSREAPE